MLRELLTAARLLAVLTLVTGLGYPLLVTGLAQAIFPHAAAGSLVDAAGRPLMPGDAARGSALVGQPFGDRKYLWGRPSATAPTPGNAAA
jgi:K+-transporting ATPase ATPase C chain